jgi:protein-tyrosine phosphatase
MTKKKVLWSTLAIALVTLAVVQFIPAPPVVVPVTLPVEEREAHRLLNFAGIDNFRDLGGYATEDGRQVKWGVLYRSGTWHGATPADTEAARSLGLATFVDFRSGAEKEMEPDQLPQPTGFDVVEIPILDEGNATMVAEIMQRIESGDFEGFDPDALMIEGNRQFATLFTPQYRQFMQAVIAADGQPVLWHCSAGKDRAGFAAAILLRILGVPAETVMRDYMASRDNALSSRRGQLRLLALFKGGDAAAKLETLLGVDEAWLQAGFDAIDDQWGGFDAYVRNGLGLTEVDIERLRDALLEPPPA